MAKELPEVSALYDHKSIAEQRSVDVALELLNLDKYDNLRRCICATEDEKTRFRQLLLHCVLATDIFEPELKARRNLRWDQAFHYDKESSTQQEGPLSEENMNSWLIGCLIRKSGDKIMKNNDFAQIYVP